MKQARLTDSQIIEAIKRMEAGLAVAEVKNWCQPVFRNYAKILRKVLEDWYRYA